MSCRGRVVVVDRLAGELDDRAGSTSRRADMVLIPSRRGRALCLVVVVRVDDRDRLAVAHVDDEARSRLTCRVSARAGRWRRDRRGGRCGTRIVHAFPDELVDPFSRTRSSKLLWHALVATPVIRRGGRRSRGREGLAEDVLPPRRSSLTWPNLDADQRVALPARAAAARSRR